MSIYDPPARRLGRRGRGRGWLIALPVALAAAGTAFFVGPAVIDMITVADDPASTGDSWLVSPPDQEVRAACVDPTGSSATTFATDVLSSLADGVAGWAGPESGAGLPARPGLHLVVRTVSTNSPATEGQIVLDREVPPVPGLAAPPAFDDPEFTTERQAWDRAASTRSEAWRAADAESTALAADLRALRLDRETNSAISGCLAAAAASTDQSSSRTLMLASDLIENEAPVTGAYGDSPVLLVFSCPVGAEADCPARVTDWAARLTGEGAGEVQSVRADAAAREIEEWVKQS